MHELSLAMNILDVAASEARRSGATRVLVIHLKVGQFAGVAREALVAAFELAREGTPLAETRLIVEEVPVQVACPTCGEPRLVESPQSLCCVACGTFTAQVVSGRELEIVALEVEP